MPTRDRLIPLCPRDFKEAVQSYVCAFDQPGYQTSIDPDSGETVGPESNPDLIGMIAGVDGRISLQPLRR
jgi:hypothetical protein